MSAVLESKPGVIGKTIWMHCSQALFDLGEPQAESVFIDDIAWNLSKLCRFNGSCADHYSVAQHSILVSHLVPPEFAFEALMHDAAEAYVGDMTSPMKQLVTGFKDVETRVWKAIAKRFDIPETMPPEVKVADYRALHTEKRDLTSSPGRVDWNGLSSFPPAEERIVPMPHFAARLAFLKRFYELRPNP